MARVLSISTDLMLGSRVDATLSAAGHEVVTSASLEEAPLEGHVVNQIKVRKNVKQWARVALDRMLEIKA